MDIFNRETSWARRYLKVKTAELEYSDITKLLLDHPNTMNDILRIVRVYDDIGDAVVSRYFGSGLDMEQVSSSFLAVLANTKERGNFAMNTAYLSSYADLMEAYLLIFNDRVDSLKNTSNEDLIVDLIHNTISNAELQRIPWELRYNMLKLMVKDWMFNTEEAVALRIIETTPHSQATLLLNEIVKKDPIYSNLLRGIPPYGSILMAL